MAIIYDSLGNEVRALDTVGGDTLTDTRVNTVSLGVIQAETVFDCAGTNSAVVDVRGTFSATLNMEATIDGTNYFSIPVFVPTTEIWQVNITAAGSYVGHLPSGCKKVRVRCSAYTSGAAIVALRGSTGDNIVYAKPIPATVAVTNTGAAAAAVTLTLAAPGAGLFHYITRLIIKRFATTLLTAGATPVLVTTTNLPGTRVFSFPAEAAAQGTIYSEIIAPAQPLKSSAANTATTIVAPVTTGVIWRITADYYVGA